MKKIFTLLVAFIATTSIFAQSKTSMDFSGTSSYSATVGLITISGGADNDILTVSADYSTLTFPSMTVQYLGMPMTVPSMTIKLPAYTMTGNPMQGNAVFTWDKAATDTVINFPSEGNKTIKITSLNAVFTQSDKTLDTKFVFKYGSMPGYVTFTEKGTYVAPTDINAVAATENKQTNTRKVMKNGQLTILKDGMEFNTAGQRIK